MSRTRIYKTWRNIIVRTTYKNIKSAKNYSLRGIVVCNRWKSFDNFYEDMKCGYSDELTIERKNNNGNYEPGNCRWATRLEQANNKSNNHYLEHGGLRLTISQWAARLGVRPRPIGRRLERGWSTQKALTTPFKA